MARCTSVVMSARGGVRSGRRRARQRVSIWFPFFSLSIERVFLVLDLEDALGDW
jgi:hypothetical protein